MSRRDETRVNLNKLLSHCVNDVLRRHVWTFNILEAFDRRKRSSQAPTEPKKNRKLSHPLIHTVTNSRRNVSILRVSSLFSAAIINLRG